jgi:hypothetical protein
MPIEFDQRLEYEFVLFFDDRSLADSSETKDLPKTISQQQPDSKSFGLKLGSREDTTVVQRGTPLPQPMVTWKAGSGIWKLVWTPQRLDLYFDALGYQEIAGPIVTIAEAKERVRQNLADVVAASTRGITRLALIVSAESSCHQGPQPSQLVAGRFFNTEIQTGVVDKNILDLTSRVNFADSWELRIVPKEDTSVEILSGGGHPGKMIAVRINKIETATSNWKYEDGKEFTTLAWQIDVNTSVSGSEDRSFHPGAISEFLNRAEKWVSDRLTAVGMLDVQTK